MLRGFLLFRFKRFLSTDRAFYDKLKEITGLYPHNEELYKLAFVHKSASIKESHGVLVNNERLEYLGDAVLDAVVAEYLYNKFPEEKEGFLTQTRSKIVNGASLGQLALQLGIDEFIVSHTQNHHTNKHILGDAFEAFIGAIYLDHGYNAVCKFVNKQLLSKHIDILTVVKTERNYKSKLIERAQKDKKEIFFETKQVEEGGGNLPEFTSVVFIDKQQVGVGKGFSKKEAEQDASNKTLKKMSLKNKN